VGRTDPNGVVITLPRFAVSVAPPVCRVPYQSRVSVATQLGEITSEVEKALAPAGDGGDA
jgi:hypothetical protein